MPAARRNSNLRVNELREGSLEFMCVLLTLLLLGPRVVIFVSWLYAYERWSDAYSTFIIPLLGFFFMPWTALTYVYVAPHGNLAGWDFLWMALAVLLDLGTYAGGTYGNRERIPGYP
jgi:hypothetical protein